MKKILTQIIYLILLIAGFTLLIIELYPKSYLINVTPSYLPLIYDLVFSIGASILLVTSYIYKLIYSKYFYKSITILDYIIYGIGLASLLFEGIIFFYVKAYNIAIYVTFVVLLILLIVQIYLSKKQTKIDQLDPK